MRKQVVAITKNPHKHNSNLNHPAKLFCLSLLTSVAAGNLLAADIVKNNTAGNLNTTPVWTGGVVPASGDVAVFDSTVSGAALTNALGANTGWKGIRVANPGGPVTISTGSSLTNGPAGIDMTAATAGIVFSNTLRVAPNSVQQWNVAGGQTLSVLGGFDNGAANNNAQNSGLVQIGTTGTVIVGTNTSGVIVNSQGNPLVTYGTSDWAASINGIVGAAVYTNATGSMSGGTNIDVQGSFNVGTVDVNSVRFNSPTPFVVTVTAAATHTARGILVTPNSGGGAFLGATGFIRPSRSSTAGVAFPIINNSANDFMIGANLGNASSSTPVAVVKAGPGNLILTNGGNGYTGGTVVEGGTLTLAASGAASSGSVLVTNARLAELTGRTNVGNALVTLAANSTNTVRVLTTDGQTFIGSNYLMNAGATRVEFVYSPGVSPSATAAPMLVGNLTNNSTASVDVYGGAFAVGVFPLLKYTNTLNGAGSFTVGNLPARVSGTISNDTVNKAIDLVITSVTSPITWATTSGTWQTGGGTIWKDTTPASVAYQEVASPYGPFGDAVVFDDSAGAGTRNVTVSGTVSPAAMTVNAANDYNFSGSSIAGSFVLTKTLGGALTLPANNTFSGGININGGTVNFSALANLGTGPISFGGGTLRYNGNSDDISVRTVTFNAGGGTIDTGSTDINFAGQIGNNGAGGLTKTGSGKLTLTATNRYSGVTLVQQGLLDLQDNIAGTNTAIPNSSAIIVNAGARFGSTDGGGVPNTLSAAVNQILGGAGTIEGDLISPAGTTITPGTNGTIATLTFNNNLNIGGTVVYDVTSFAVRDLLSVAGSVTINPSTLQVNATGPLVDGVYPIIQAGGISGSVGNIGITGFAQPGKVAILTQTATEIDLNISDAATDTLTWRGIGSDWDQTSLNWLKGASPFLYTNGDFVTFDESGAGAPNVNLDGTFVPGSVTVSNDVTTYTFNDNASGLGKFVGPVRINKTGPGTLVVLTANNSFGPTVISNGTVQVGNNSTTGDLGTGNITNAGALVFQQPDSRTVSGAISGAGSLTQNGGSTLTLAGNTTYTGPTTVSLGSLMLGTGGASGTLASSTVTNNGSLILNSKTSWTYSGAITGSGTLVKAGTNTFSLGGANNYTGATTVSNGVFKNTSSLPVNGPVNIYGGKFDINGLSFTPGTVGTPGTPTSGGLLMNDTTLNQTNTVTFGTGDTSADLGGAIVDNDGLGGAQGKIAVVKVGTGTLTLRSNNTFTGGAHIVGGTLQAASSGFGYTGNATMENGTRLLMFQQGGTPGIGFNLTFGTPGTTVFLDANALGIGFGGAVIGDTNSMLVITNPLSFSQAASNQFQLFPGTVLVASNSTANSTLRFSSTSLTRNGGDFTTFVVDPSSTINTRNAGAVTLGALSGSGFVGGTQVTNGGTVTYTIGTKNLGTVFSGTLTGIIDTNTTTGNQTANYIKVGTAKLTLDGTLLYEGQTTVSNGILAIGSGANANTALTNTSGYQISSGGTLDLSATVGGVMNGILSVDNHTNIGGFFVTNQFLAGGGTIIGNVSSPNGRVFPGDGIGTLTVTGNATLAGSMLMELNMTNGFLNDELAVGGAIDLTGCALTVTNLGPTLKNGTTFQLFNKLITGTPASVTLPGSPYVWTDNLHTDGTITLFSGGVNGNPTNITANLSGTTLSLSWPADHLGWQLLVQTNNLTNGLSGVKTDWAVVNGSVSVTSTNITINRNNKTTFYRLVLPY